MGAFDKMAGFNWTNKGLSTAVENYKPEPGKIDTKIDSDKNAPAVSVDSDKVNDAILTDDDKKAIEAGQNVDVKISVTDAANKVSSDAKAAIEDALKAAADKNASVKVGQYLDISIKKTVGGEKPTDVKETAKKISFTVDIPETMKNTDKNVSRTYYIIRMHDNKAEVIATASQTEVESGKITFATDKFSTYAIAYADVTVKPDDGKKDDTTVTTPDNGNNAADDAATGSITDTKDTTDTTPKTGDTNASMWMLLAIMGMTGIAFVTAKKRSLVRK